MRELAESAARVERDIATLTGPPYTEGGPGITRHAYTEAYLHTLEFFAIQFRAIGFDVWHDPIGNMVATNRARNARCFGLGSHCDSVRNGGAYDGIMGMVAALEVCRLARERRIDPPLRVISFLEEEGSGFGQLLLGSRVATGSISDEELQSLVNDDGLSFIEAARAAGYDPERHQECRRVLDGLLGWIEVHIEQGRVLESEGLQIGIVDAVAGYVHADVEIVGRSDHAGATPMNLRSDAAITAARAVLALEEMARACSEDTVGTIGELELDPGAINVIPGRARFSLDMRSVSGDHFGLASDIEELVRRHAKEREQRSEYRERQRVPPTPLDATIVGALESAVQEAEVPARRMHSAAAHDTMMVAREVPAAMLFVPCVDGVSHAPEERADPVDGALAAETILAAVERLVDGDERGGIRPRCAERS